MNIAFIDTTGNRRKALCKYWAETLGETVYYYDAGEFRLFNSSTIPHTDSRPIPTFHACIMHSTDVGLLKVEPVKKCVESSPVKIGYSGGGLQRIPDGFAPDWHPIARSIEGPESAISVDWEELRDWIKLTLDGDEAVNLPMLLSGRDRQYLRALYILGMGFKAATLGSDTRLQAHQKEVLSRNWWTVPLLASADCRLESIVANEWSSKVPDAVKHLIEWILDKSSKDFRPAKDIPTAIELIRKRIEAH